MCKPTYYDWIALIIVIIGGLNWGLIGLFNFNLIGVLFGDMSILSRLIYTIVGIATLYVLFVGAKMCRCISRECKPEAKK